MNQMQLLGKGAFSFVFKAKDMNDDKDYAIKITIGSDAN